MLCDSAHLDYPTPHCTLPAHISSVRRISTEFSADPASVIAVSSLPAVLPADLAGLQADLCTHVVRNGRQILTFRAKAARTAAKTVQKGVGVTPAGLSMYAGSVAGQRTQRSEDT
jgi:hypothetical protein